MLANTTATIYNKSVDYNTDAVVYNRTVLPAVHWEDGISAAAKGKSRAEDRPVFVSIDFIVASEMEKQYLPAHEYAQLPTTDQSKYWTLAIGDILLKGTVEDEIPDRGIKHWLAQHPQAASITALETLDLGSKNMQHWEVTAK